MTSLMQKVTSKETLITDDHVYRLDLYFGPFVHSHQKLPQRSMNRSELQDALIQQMLDESYGKYSEKELIAEVEEYYPHILEESNTN